MILFLCAQDIGSLWVGLIRQSAFAAIEKCSVPPESYLSALNRFLKEQHQLPQELSGVCVVTGPGSFTSTRVSLTIANALHFTERLPLFTLINPDHLLPNILLAKCGLGIPVKSGRYASAVYGRPPHVSHGDKWLDS